VPRECKMQSGECRLAIERGPRRTGCRRLNGSASSCMKALSAAINGISREKAPAVAKFPPSLKLWRTGPPSPRRDKKQGEFSAGRGRDYAIATGISRCRLMGKRHGQGNDGQRNGRKGWHSCSSGCLGAYPKGASVRSGQSRSDWGARLGRAFCASPVAPLRL